MDFLLHFCSGERCSRCQQPCKWHGNLLKRDAWCARLLPNRYIKRQKILLNIVWTYCHFNFRQLSQWTKSVGGPFHTVYQTERRIGIPLHGFQCVRVQGSVCLSSRNSACDVGAAFACSHTVHSLLSSESFPLSPLSSYHLSSHGKREEEELHDGARFHISKQQQSARRQRNVASRCRRVSRARNTCPKS